MTTSAYMGVVPSGADTISLSPDGLTYPFTIRSGQRFSNGRHVKASDYAYSINRALNPCLPGNDPTSQEFNPTAPTYLSAIEGASTFSAEKCLDSTICALGPAPGQTTRLIRTLYGYSIVPDDTAGTLTITLAQPASYFLQALTTPAGRVVDKHVVGPNECSDAWANHMSTALSQGLTGQGGSGMFYVSHWNHTDSTLVLKPNLNWWGRAAGMTPTLTEIDWSFYNDPTMAYNDYTSTSGKYDYLNLNLDQAVTATTRRDYHHRSLLGFTAILMDHKMPPFDDPNARAAFCLAIDRNKLNTDVFNGQMFPSWSIMPGYNPNLTGPDGVTSTAGDQAKATSHWQTYLTTPGVPSSFSIMYQYYALPPLVHDQLGLSRTGSGSVRCGSCGQP